MATELLALRVTCPHCDRQQNIVANPIPDNLIVRCSNCHEVLGIWHDLKAVSLAAASHRASQRPA